MTFFVPVVPSAWALARGVVVSMASTLTVYTVLGERELMDPITVFPLKWANTTGPDGEFTGVAKSWYELAPAYRVHLAVIVLDVTVYMDTEIPELGETQL